MNTKKKNFYLLYVKEYVRGKTPKLEETKSRTSTTGGQRWSDPAPLKRNQGAAGRDGELARPIQDVYRG